MKRIILKDLVVLLLMIAIIYVICLFLPDRVPIHFNAQGKVDMVINKYYLLFGTVIPYSVYWQFFRRHKIKNK